MIDFEAGRYDPLGDQTFRDWGHARRKVLYQRVVCAVTQCSVDMMSFGQVKERLRLGTPHYRGLQQIPLEQVKGSVGRYKDFTSAFLPRRESLQDRWMGVEKVILAGKAPPIDVYKVGNAYFVVDGNHRVSVGRQLGLETIEAFVTEFDTPFDLGPDDDIDNLLVEAEQREFMKQAGESNAEAASNIVLSCAGCYRDLGGQIEAYQAGMVARDGRPVSSEEAFSAWHEDVYETALEAVRQEGLLEFFPERSEADLFVWSWQNSQELEEAADE
jgi:uncharacterized ParB-like nuclease family protein